MAHPPLSESNTQQCQKSPDWEIKRMETQEWHKTSTQQIRAETKRSLKFSFEPALNDGWITLRLKRLFSCIQLHLDIIYTHRNPLNPQCLISEVQLQIEDGKYQWILLLHRAVY